MHSRIRFEDTKFAEKLRARSRHRLCVRLQTACPDSDVYAQLYFLYIFFYIYILNIYIYVRVLVFPLLVSPRYRPVSGAPQQDPGTGLGSGPGSRPPAAAASGGLQGALGGVRGCVGEAFISDSG